MGNPVWSQVQVPAGAGNGIALSQSLAGAGNLTLNGALVSGGVATLSPPRRVYITSAGNDAGITFTVYGTDRYGTSISEVMQGANGAATSRGVGYSVNDFLTVTRIAASGATASTVTAGTGAVASSPWFGWSHEIAPLQVGIGCEVSGTATATVEHTYDDPNAAYPGAPQPNANSPPLAWADPVINAVSANTQTSLPGPNGVPSVVFASRLTVFSGTGTVTFQAIQAGITN